ncbi:hypothetical protein AB0H00_23860 [Nocardia sp. NPDC023852]|uniref:hypothetical protein n=1 Tax=Nocardia sp. NPDC023852 TaxID=3154697 RepID=UPI0033E21B1D
MRTDKFARHYHAAICLATTLIWLRTSLINTAEVVTTQAEESFPDAAVTGRTESYRS